MNMFKSTAAKTPEEYIDSLIEPRKSDIKQLFDLIQKTLPSEKPFIISGMIGFVPYHYKYASGREGEWMLIGLASQKNYISLYVCAATNGQYVAEKNKDKLPKASIGKSCIRLKKFADIDQDALVAIIKEAQEVYKVDGFAM